MGIYPVETITEIQHYLQQLQHGSNLDAYQQKAKAAVVHMYNGILAINRNTFESLPMRWVNPVTE